MDELMATEFCYEIKYDRTDKNGVKFFLEKFEGTPRELRAHLKEMAKQGCTDIIYTVVRA